VQQRILEPQPELAQQREEGHRVISRGCTEWPGRANRGRNMAIGG
jgi:hypothetical protein